MANTAEISVTSFMHELSDLLGLKDLDVDTATALYELLVKFYTDAYVDGRTDPIE